MNDDLNDNTASGANIYNLREFRRRQHAEAKGALEAVIEQLQDEGIPPFVVRDALADLLIRKQPANPWRNPLDVASCVSDFWFFTCTANRLGYLADELWRKLRKAGHDPYEHP